MEERAVSASVQVGVRSLELGRRGGRAGARAGGRLGQLVLELLHLLSQTLHRVEAVGGDGVRKGLGGQKGDGQVKGAGRRRTSSTMKTVHLVFVMNSAKMSQQSWSFQKVHLWQSFSNSGAPPPWRGPG